MIVLLLNIVMKSVTVILDFLTQHNAMGWKNFLPFSGKLPVPKEALHSCHDLKVLKSDIKNKTTNTANVN